MVPCNFVFTLNVQCNYHVKKKIPLIYLSTNLSLMLTYVLLSKTSWLRTCIWQMGDNILQQAFWPIMHQLICGYVNIHNVVEALTWGVDFAPVHPGEGSSSVALLKVSSLFFPLKGYLNTHELMFTHSSRYLSFIMSLKNERLVMNYSAIPTFLSMSDVSCRPGAVRVSSPRFPWTTPSDVSRTETSSSSPGGDAQRQDDERPMSSSGNKE